MGSLSFGEIITILVIILIIFGPKRLPEFARKVGELIAWARKSLRDFTETIEGELGEGTQPLADLKREFDGARNDLTGAINSIGGSGSSQPTDRNDTDRADGGDQPGKDTETSDSESTEDHPIDGVGGDSADSSRGPDDEDAGDDSAEQDST